MKFIHKFIFARVDMIARMLIVLLNIIILGGTAFVLVKFLGGSYDLAVGFSVGIIGGRAIFRKRSYKRSI